MKFDPNPERQTQRIDHQKANRIRCVSSIPESGVNGDLIALGDDNEISDLLLRERGTWVSLLGGLNTGIKAVIEQAGGLEDTLGTLRDIISRLENDIADNRRDIDDLERDIRDLQNGNIQNDINDLKRRVNDLENR